ncbi:MAG: phage tail tape measure protein, partial [Clostridia bacterium]|nr:phage tail tape measure protein [Clostridia bacterium]
MAQAAVKDTTGYVNYVYNISARGTTEVASQLLGLSGMATNILGQLAFQTSSYLSTTEGALLSMGVIATAGFTKATQQAMEFDQALSTVGAISGKTRDEVSSLGDDAMAMSNKFGVAVSEMTQGMESLARAGVSQNNMTAILEEAMGLSKLEGLTLDTAINDLISTTNLLDTQNLDLSSSEYADAVRYQNQKITATSEAAPINAQDIIHTLEHIGGYASSTNLDQDDLYAVIAQLGSKGTKSEMAGTSLRAFISAGQKDTAQRALDRIGLSVKDLWKNDDTIMSISDMKDVLDEAMESRGYTQQEKLEFYSDFAGYKQANQIMKIDTSSVREFKEKIDHSWNMGQKINQVIGTAETHVQGLVQAGTNLLTKVGEPFLPIISTIAWTLRTGIDIINAIPGSNLIIAGGLILASVKAISTIFNKIVPQIVAAKGNIGSMGGFFGTIKKDLKESYTIIKNINNTDWIQKKSHSIESNRVTDNDRIEYWQKRTGKDLYGMTDVYRLEKFHGFKTDDRRYKEHIRNQKYTRNERQEASNPPKENTKDNKIESQLDKIISIIQNLEDPNQAYNIGSLIPVINNTLTYINGSLAQINKKLQSFKDGNISGKTKIDFSDIKNHTFKVEITNATRIIPVHDVGSVAWGQQRKADREVRDFTTRGKVVVQDNLTHRGQKVKGFGNYRTKTLNLDTKYFDDAKYHELGHVLFSDDNRNRRSDKIKISKSDNKILNKSNLVASKHYKTLGNIVNEYEADLFAVGLARKRGETVSKKRLERMNLAKQVLDNHKVFDDVREEYIDAMINAVLIEDEEIQKQLNNTINEYERKKVQTAKNKSNRRKKPTLEEQKTQILKDKQSREETKIKHKAKYDANKINDVDFFTDVRGPIKDGDFASYYLTSEDISNFIDALDIDFGFDLNTTEGQKAQKLMLNQFKQVAEANIFANKNNITGGSKKSLLQKIDKELTDYMDVFRNTGAASLVMMDTDATVYSEEDLKSKLAVPSYMLPFSNYDVTKNTVRQKTANELKNVLEYGANPLLHSIKKTKVANYESLEMDFINQIAKEDEEIKRGLEQYNKEQKYSYEVGVGANKRGVLATGKAAREHLYARALNTKISKNIDIEEPTLFNEPKLMMGGINLNVSQLKSLNSAIKHTYEKQLGGNFEELKEGLEQTKAENIVLHNLDLALQVNDDEKRKKFIEDVYGRISGEKGLEKKRKKAKKHKFNRRTGLDYSDFTLDELHAIAYTSGVNITELQNRMVGKNNPQSAWSKPSEVAEAISEQHKIKLGIARKFHTNKIANYFLNNLTTEAQQQFLKEMGINQEDPVLGLVEYLTAQTKAKNKDGTYEKDADGNIIMHRKY